MSRPQRAPNPAQPHAHVRRSERALRRLASSVAVRVPAVFLVATLAPLVVSLAQTRAEWLAADERAYEQAHAVVRAAAAEVNGSIYEARQAAATVARLPAFWQGEDADRDQMLAAFWLVAVNLPAGAVYGPIYAAALQRALLSLAVALVALALLGALWRGLAPRLRALQDAAAHWSGGDWAHRARIGESDDEVGRLAVAFDGIAEHVQRAEAQREVACADATSLAREAHALKGEAGMIGASEVQAIARELELQARGGAWTAPSHPWPGWRRPASGQPPRWRRRRGRRARPPSSGWQASPPTGGRDRPGLTRRGCPRP